MGELPVARRFDRCSMTLCDEKWQLAILAVDLSIIRETLSHTLGARKDTPAAYGQGQQESRRTATMLEFPNGSQICAAAPDRVVAVRVARAIFIIIVFSCVSHYPCHLM